MHQGKRHITILILLATALCAPAREPEAQHLDLNDPVKPDDAPKPYTVELVFDETGLPTEYRMFLHTDICLDRVCNPLEATLVWDPLGQILRIDYEEDNPLTKGDHDPFTDDDYSRLISILQDRDSILGRNPLEYFLVKPEERDDIDGVTSATPAAVKNAVVEGAAYSTWALWHWSNGDVQQHIRARTASQCTDDYLLYCLTSGDDRFMRFALWQLTEEPSENARIRETVLSILRSENETLCRLALGAYHHMQTDGSPAALAETVGVNPASTRMILKELKKLESTQASVYETLAKQLELLSDQNDIKLALDLLAEHASDSDTVRRCVADLTEGTDPIIRFYAEKFLDI